MKIDLIGRPNASQFHPDHIPTKFPAVYKQSQPSVEQQSERIKRAIDRHLRVQQAINVQQVKKEDAEKESMKVRQREQREARDAERRRKREEKENEKQVKLAERQLKLQKAQVEQEAKRVKEKQRRQTKQAEREEKKKTKHLQQLERDELKLFAEREVARLEEEMCSQDCSRMIPEYQQLTERAVAYCNEVEAFIHAEEEKLRQAAIEKQEEETKRARAKIEGLRSKYFSYSDSQTQTPPDQLSILLAEIEQLKSELKSSRFSFRMLEGNDLRTKFCTGLPSWPVFLYVFTFVSLDLNSHGNHALCLEDQFFITLVKLRLNLLFEDVAHRFGISISTASCTFSKWLDILFIRLNFLIAWPQKEVILQNMAPAFTQLYPRCVCVIDCSEIFIETPCSFTARSATYSNYKKHNTIKFSIGITPSGAISFLSRCWGGRVSDEVLTQQSGFLDMLEQGDTVLADRGFTIEDDIALRGAKLVIPSFMKGKMQLSQKEVETSKQLSHVWIHVERIIGLPKNKYTILKGPLSTVVVKHKDDTDFARIGKLLVVCSALTNLSTSVVS